ICPAYSVTPIGTLDIFDTALQLVNTVSVSCPRKDAQVISLGDYHGLALDSRNSVWSWGNNSSGQLGNEQASQRNNKPIPAKLFANIVSATGGDSHSLALDDQGVIWSWGE